MQATRFAVEGRNLEAALFYPADAQPKNPAVFFVHGWTSRKENYARRAAALADLGYIALTFDLSGQGASPGALGDFSRQDHLADVVGAFDFLAANEDVDSDRIGVCGISYGAYLAAIATSHRPMPWLAMRVPALYPDEAFTTPTADLIARAPDIFKAHQGQTPRTNMALRAVSGYQGEILIVRSGEDELIPEATTDAYVAAADSSRLTYEVMKGADHSIFREDRMVGAEWEGLPAAVPNFVGPQGEAGTLLDIVIDERPNPDRREESRVHVPIAVESALPGDAGEQWYKEGDLWVRQVRPAKPTDYLVDHFLPQMDIEVDFTQFETIYPYVAAR